MSILTVFLFFFISPNLRKVTLIFPLSPGHPSEISLIHYTLAVPFKRPSTLYDEVSNLRGRVNCKIFAQSRWSITRSWVQRKQVGSKGNVLENY